MKKEFFGWVVFALYVFAIISGLGWCIYNKLYIAAFSVAYLAVLAFPKAKEAFKKATGRDEDK